MTEEQAAECIDALARDNPPGKDRHVLYCAPGIQAALSALHGKTDLHMLGHTYIATILSYPPGQWKLIRHDNCEVTGGDGIDQAMIVSHGNCTVLAESGQP